MIRPDLANVDPATRVYALTPHCVASMGPERQIGPDACVDMWRPCAIATIGRFSVYSAVPWFARLAWSWRPAYDVMQDLRGPTLNASALISIPSLHSAP